MNIYNPFPSPLFDSNGSLAVGAKAYFYLAGTTTPLTVYQDAALLTPHTWPVVAGINGTLPPVYVPYVDYRVRITTSSGALIFGPVDIDNPAPPTEPVGGIAVQETQIFRTGFILGMLSDAALSGFVKMNGGTIGSAASSGTLRSNADCEALFKHLYLLDDAIATVGGGRGASADIDWAANKAIVVPTMQGIVLGGLDTMGAAAANRIQVSTTANVTNGSANIVVASASGLCRFMLVYIDDVAAGYVSAISGTTITLSAAYTGATAAGVATRFSFIDNAEEPGATGGFISWALAEAELASHTHALTDPTHAHGVDATKLTGGGSDVAGGPGQTQSDVSTTGAAATGITAQATGSNQPFGVMQPTRLGTFYIKL